MQMSMKEVRELLAQRGIEVTAWGCGCCGSPGVVIKIDGEKVWDDEGNFDELG